MRKEGLAKKALLDKAQPIQLRLKHGDEVQRLRLKLLPLIELESKGRSMSLTMDDLKKLKVRGVWGVVRREGRGRGRGGR
jgi:hypothetical protein